MFKMLYINSLAGRKENMNGYKKFLRDYLRIIISENLHKKLDEINNMSRYLEIRKINSCMMKYYSKMKIEEIEKCIEDLIDCYGIEEVKQAV